MNIFQKAIGIGALVLSLAGCESEEGQPVRIEDCVYTPGVVQNEDYTPGTVSRGLMSTAYIDPVYTFSMRFDDGSEKVFSVKGFDTVPESANTLINTGDSVRIYAMPKFQNLTYGAELSTKHNFKKVMTEIGATRISEGLYLKKVSSAKK